MPYYGARGRKRKRFYSFRNRKRQRLLRRKIGYRRKRYYGKRAYYRKKARAGRRLRLSNLYKSVRYTFFRGSIKEIQVNAGRKVIHDIQGVLNNVLDIHAEGTAASPTNQQRMFKNNSITYEKFRILSFQYHFWVTDIGVTDSDTYHKMEVHKIYDRNGDDVKHTEGTITSFINCKFKRLEPGKHYVQTLRPQYLQRRFTGAVSGGLEMMRTARFDNPWWDTSACNTVEEIRTFPKSDNKYSLLFNNPDNINAKQIRGYYTCYMKFRGYSRVTTK